MALMQSRTQTEAAVKGALKVLNKVAEWKNTIFTAQLRVTTSEQSRNCVKYRSFT